MPSKSKRAAFTNTVEDIRIDGAKLPDETTCQRQLSYWTPPGDASEILSCNVIAVHLRQEDPNCDPTFPPSDSTTQAVAKTEHRSVHPQPFEGKYVSLSWRVTLGPAPVAPDAGPK